MPQVPSEAFVGKKKGWWMAIFRDIQFWVPVGVLLIGLLLLRIAL